MGTVVSLKITDGSFARGFSVILQVGLEGKCQTCERVGRLAPAPHLPLLYDRWQTSYRHLGLPFRLEPVDGAIAYHSRIEDCQQATRQLHQAFNDWLRCDAFRQLRETILQHCQPEDPVRLLVQTDDLQLQQLPWCAWEGFDAYPLAEVAMSAPNYERVAAASPSPYREPARGDLDGSHADSRARVLALLGTATNAIAPEADAAIVEQHPDMEVIVANAPHLQESLDWLWSNPWDILLFSGHSASDEQGGWMSMDDRTRIAIADLKPGLQQAIRQGLQLVIFNSCDGLGLAQQLSALNVPQAIVMREPVPDRVARAFLSYFLNAFARADSLYTAVREARERLRSWEDRYPCASWLPVIYQNPAVRPPSWQQLCGRHPDALPASAPTSDGNNTSEGQNTEAIPSLKPAWQQPSRWLVVLAASAIATLSAIGLRATGRLERLELAAFDRVIALRPAEPLDSRLLVVTLSEADIRAQPQTQRQGSLSDRSLLLLLEILESARPRAIGLDIYRDHPASTPVLAERLQRSQHLITVCKVSDASVADPGIAPPPEVSVERWGFADFVTDRDAILRRHLLAFTPEPTSECATPYAFSTQLAFRYLAHEGIVPRYTPAGELQLGDRILTPLHPRQGAYRNADLWGHQILLNYRTLATGDAAVRQVSLTDVLDGRLNPDFVRDRVVLIGTIARSYGDVWLTPHSATSAEHRAMPGVLVQAQMVGQLLAAVLDDRPLLTPLSGWADGAWIASGAAIGSLLGLMRSPLRAAIASGIAGAGLGGTAFVIATTWGGWVPVVPTALAGAMGAAIVAIQRVRQ